MVQKKHSTNFYLIMAFFVASVLFISGIGIGLVIDQFKTESLDTSISGLQSSIQDAEIELLLMDYLGGNLSCNYLNIKSAELVQESADLGARLDTFEQSNQINADAYVPLKQEYTRVLIKNWLTLENIKLSCNSDYNTILYFYNNIDCEECDTQAYVLQYLKNTFGNNVMIFAIDAGLNMGIVDMLIYNYDIEEYPSLIINGALYSGYQDVALLNELLT